MTGFDTQYRSERRTESRTLWAVTVLCLVLLALLAAVQVAHFHTNETVADHCPLCVSMHSAAPVAVAAAAIVLVSFGHPAQVFRVRAVVRNWHPKLFTRPPPSGC